MFCIKCGFELRDGANFCDKCGCRIEYKPDNINKSPSPVAQPAPVIQPEAPAAQPAAEVQTPAPVVQPAPVIQPEAAAAAPSPIKEKASALLKSAGEFISNHKKLLAIIVPSVVVVIVAVILICTLGNSPAFKPVLPIEGPFTSEDGDYKYMTQGEDAYITAYLGSEEELIIPAEIDGFNVRKIGYGNEPPFAYCSFLEYVKIPDGVTEIGYFAFYDCESLEEVEMSDSVTSIGENAFSFCESLETVEMSDSLTSIGASAFNNCESLEEIEIPDSVTSIGASAFDSCESLKEIEIPDSVTSIGKSAFYSCDALISVEIPSSVKEIGDGAFSYGGLESVEIAEGVEVIGNSAFACTHLRTVEIPRSVTSIGDDVFYFCLYLENIEVDSKNRDYTSVDGVLYTKDMEKLLCYPAGSNNKTFTLPSEVTEISESAFCSNSLESIEVKRGGTSFKSEDGVLFSKDMKKLIAYPENAKATSYYIPDDVEVICSYAFAGCDLWHVEIPEGVTEIGKHAFSYCSYLSSFRLPDSLTTIGEYAFPDNYTYPAVVYAPHDTDYYGYTIGDLEDITWVVED